jgi:hypothetical protein
LQQPAALTRIAAGGALALAAAQVPPEECFVEEESGQGASSGRFAADRATGGMALAPAPARHGARVGTAAAAAGAAASLSPAHRDRGVAGAARGKNCGDEPPEEA